MASDEPRESPLPAPALRALEEEYEFLREVGRGGMAAVYLARARASGRVVAIKTVAAHRAHDPEAVARFEREARTVLALDHPNIVRSYSVEQLEGGALAIVMQHAAGGTLREALRASLRDGVPFPPERVAQILADVAAALAHAHERGVVHRDVKPENIFLDPRNGRALLSDFGIARHLEGDNALTMTGSAIGTPTYMSPEQIDGRRVDGRSDVYALGLVGWELLAGARPWEGDSLYSVIYKQKHEALAPLAELRPDAPPALRAAIERALRKDPAERWPSAESFGDAVRDAVRDAELPATLLAAAPPAAVAHGVGADGAGGVDGVDGLTRDAAVEERPVPTAVEEPEDDAPIVEAPALDVVPVGAGDVGVWDQPIDTVRTTPRSRYGSTRPAARLAVPLALALVAALAVRQGARARRATPAVVPADSPTVAVTLPAGGDVASPESSASDARGAAGRNAPASVATESSTRPAVASAATTTAAAKARTPHPAAPVGLARFALTHGDSLALCRSAAPRDQRACFSAVLADRDAPLNAAYARLARELRRRDPPALARLRSEEIRWLGERDAACARAGRGREGALWAPSRAACLGDAADRRASELSARLGADSSTR